MLPLKKAMGNSLNIAAVKVELSIGVPAVLTYMRNGWGAAAAPVSATDVARVRSGTALRPD